MRILLSTLIQYYNRLKEVCGDKLSRCLSYKKTIKSNKIQIKICGVTLPFQIKIKGNIKKIYIFGLKVFSYKAFNSVIKSEGYGDWIDDLKNNTSLFVPYTEHPFKRQKDDVKIFAYYLPQFHSIEINDKNYGKGFTEWTNVASCLPLFVGHYQPKIPYDLGFYNLLMPGVMERQAEIAKAYGIYGFCFYYYWFSGKKVLEKPLEYFLKSNIDIKFHFCWANENWSKLWDGGNKDVILKQELKDGDPEKFFYDILPFIMDKRYEKIGNRPLLMVYRPSLFKKEDFRKFVNIINLLAQKEGFGNFYIIGSNSFDFDNPKEYMCEGIAEFPPHQIRMFPKGEKLISKKVSINVVDMSSYIENKQFLYDVDYKLFKACFPSWDNTPRKAYTGGFVFQLSDKEYSLWLSGILEWTKEHYIPEEQYVYINAWNEWAEGAVLEPTTRYGYKNLQIVKDCLENNRRKIK